jgi:hypothetical protein
VFVNGDLVLSNYLRGKRLIFNNSPKLDTVLATGKRVHRLMERPIVVLPKGLNAKGELAVFGKRKDGVLQERVSGSDRAFTS